MQIFNIQTDEVLHSELEYGTPEFPFAGFTDEPGRYRSRCIDWHWHAETEFVLVTEGSVICSLGTERIELCTGDGIFLNSGMIHRFESGDCGKMVTCVFLPEFISARGTLQYRDYIRPITESGTEYLVFKKSSTENAALLSALSELCLNAVSSGDPFTIQINAAELWRELFRMEYPAVRKSRQTSNKVARARLQIMISFITMRYADALTLADIADSAKISRSEALRCFRTVLQTTPMCFLTDYRLGRARYLLRNTADTVTSIAGKVGFDSAGYFCRVFKSHYLLTPREYRNSAV